MEQTTNKFQYPTEEVTLPSKGLLYPKDSPIANGKIEMKYMTAKEEDILTNQNYIENGTVIDKLLQSLIITPNIARILGYGAEYSFKYKGEEIIIDLTDIDDKFLDESLIPDRMNKFNFTLPTSKRKITFKLLTHGDEISIANELKGLKKLNKKSSAELSTRMKYIITSVDGDYEPQTIREFVDKGLLARDARALRNYILEIQPDTDLSYEYEENNGDFVTIPIPIGINFFWPDVEV